MQLIGFAGQARSGKTTASQHLLTVLPHYWTTAAFADPIKDMLRVMGVSCEDEFKDVVHPVFGKTPRYLMQTLGTQWGRNMVGNDTWVKHFAEKHGSNLVVVSDVRYPNEANLVREYGKLIHITGHGGIESDHSSEIPVEILSNDLVIENNQDLDYLYNLVEEIPLFL